MGRGSKRRHKPYFFYMSQSINIQTIASLYEETNCLNHTTMRLKGEIKVNKALDNAVERESKQSRIKPIILKAQAVHKEATHIHMSEGEVPGE